MADQVPSEGKAEEQQAAEQQTNFPGHFPKAGYPGNRPIPPGNRGRKGGNAAETVLWLLVILGLIVLVMQGTWIKLFSLQSKAAVIGLVIIAVALAAATAYSYLQGMKLRAAIQRLTEQQRRKKRVTLPSEPAKADDGEELSEEDEVWTEQVRFTAVIEERQRLARELHDAVSQQLFAISMTATAVSRTLEKDWERAKRQVQLIEEMAAVAQSEMRALLLHLRPVHLDGKNLALALQSLVDELKLKVPMNITLDVDPTIHMASEAEDHLFRITQEALSNSLRHSKADHMSIRLARQGNEARLTFQDNGIGFDLEAKKQTSYGLLTIEERVNVLGGSMQLVTEPGHGVTIDIWVPAMGFEIRENGTDGGGKSYGN